MVEFINAEDYLIDGVKVEYKITSGSLVDITNDKIYYEQFSLTESISSEGELKFGGCEAKMIKFRITNFTDNFGNYISLKGKWLSVEQIVTVGDIQDASNPLKIGDFRVDSDTLTPDMQYRDIVAYDAIYSLMTRDIADWYNGIVFPVTLKRFRESLFLELSKDIGIIQEEVILPNDEIPLRSTPFADTLYAVDVLRDICALNGCFGRINNEGVFQYRFLASEAEYSITESMYSKGNIKYEDFVTSPITAVNLYQTNASEEFSGVYIDYEREAELGFSNVYPLTLNVLYVGEDLTIAYNALLNFYEKIKHVQYTPCTISVVGNPCVECGDMVKFTANGIESTTYIFERTLSGIQKMKDEYTAQGVEMYEDSSGGTGSIVSSVQNAVAKNNFNSYTFSNTFELQITSEETTIISFNVSATSGTDVVFLGTFPITTDYDGILKISYFVDGAEVENDTVFTYLNKGYNVVTLTNFINLGNMSRFIFTVKASLQYSESVQRFHAAKIQAIENYINNGVYETVDIDKTVPTGIISVKQLKAVLLAKGTAAKDEWNGLLGIDENMLPITYDNKITVVTAESVSGGYENNEFLIEPLTNGTSTSEYKVFTIPSISIIAYEDNISSVTE